MTPFTSLEAPACPLGLANVDTDQLIPARFMQTPRAEGYGKFLLHDLRRDETGALKAGFALNDPRYADARAMIARRNFGCGSSREAEITLGGARLRGHVRGLGGADGGSGEREEEGEGFRHGATQCAGRDVIMKAQQPWRVDSRGSRR